MVKKKNVPPPKNIVYVDADIRDIIPIFLAHRSKDLQTLREAAAQHDFKTVQTIGHRMRGTGSGYGFDGISEIGQCLEEAASEQNQIEINRQIKALTFYLDHLEIVWQDTPI